MVVERLQVVEVVVYSLAIYVMMVVVGAEPRHVVGLGRSVVVVVELLMGFRRMWGVQGV